MGSDVATFSVDPDNRVEGCPIRGQMSKLTMYGLDEGLAMRYVVKAKGLAGLLVEGNPNLQDLVF